MERKFAEEVLAAAQDCDVRLNQLLRHVQATHSVEEFETLRAAVAPIIWSLFEAMVLPVYESHIDLAPESLVDVVKQSIERRANRAGTGSGSSGSG